MDSHNTTHVCVHPTTRQPTHLTRFPLELENVDIHATRTECVWFLRLIDIGIVGLDAIQTCEMTILS